MENSPPFAPSPQSAQQSRHQHQHAECAQQSGVKQPVAGLVHPVQKMVQQAKRDHHRKQRDGDLQTQLHLLQLLSATLYPMKQEPGFDRKYKGSEIRWFADSRNFPSLSAGKEAF